MTYRVIRLVDLPNPDETNDAERIQDELNDQEKSGYKLVGVVPYFKGENQAAREPMFILHKD